MKRLCLLVFTALAVACITMGHVAQVDAANEAAKWRLEKGQTLSHRYWSSPALRQQYPNPDDYYRDWAAANNLPVTPKTYRSLWPDEYLDPPVQSAPLDAEEEILLLEPFDPRSRHVPDPEVAALRSEMRALTTELKRLAPSSPVLASTAVAPPAAPAVPIDDNAAETREVLVGILTGIESLAWVLIIGLGALVMIILLLHWLSDRRGSEPINRLVSSLEWEFRALREEMKGIRNSFLRADDPAPDSGS